MGDHEYRFVDGMDTCKYIAIHLYLPMLVDGGGIASPKAKANADTFRNLIESELRKHQVHTERGKRVLAVKHLCNTAAMVVKYTDLFLKVDDVMGDAARGILTSLGMELAKHFSAPILAEQDAAIAESAKNCIQGNMETLLPLYHGMSEGMFSSRVDALTDMAVMLLRAQAAFVMYVETIMHPPVGRKSSIISAKHDEDVELKMFKACRHFIQLCKSEHAGFYQREVRYHAMQLFVDNMNNWEEGSVSIFPIIGSLWSQMDGLWLVANNRPWDPFVTRYAINVRGDGSCFYQALYYALEWTLPERELLPNPTLTGLKDHILTQFKARLHGETKKMFIEFLGDVPEAEIDNAMGQRDTYADQLAIVMAAIAFDVQLLIYRHDGTIEYHVWPPTEGKFCGKRVVTLLHTGSRSGGHFYILGRYPLMDGIDEKTGRGSGKVEYPQKLDFQFYKSDGSEVIVPRLTGECINCARCLLPCPAAAAAEAS